jgi:hypothetical protein
MLVASQDEQSARAIHIGLGSLHLPFAFLESLHAPGLLLVAIVHGEIAVFDNATLVPTKEYMAATIVMVTSIKHHAGFPKRRTILV